MVPGTGAHRIGRASSVLVIGLDAPVTAIDFHDHVVAHVHNCPNGFFGEQWAGKGECHARLGRVGLNGNWRSQDLKEIRPRAARLQSTTGIEIDLALPVRPLGPCARQRNDARESQDQRHPTARHRQNSRVPDGRPLRIINYPLPSPFGATAQPPPPARAAPAIPPTAVSRRAGRDQRPAPARARSGRSAPPAGSP